MLICPTLAARISPKLSAFETPWIEKSDAEFISFIFFLLVTLVSRLIILFLIKQMDLPFATQIEFGSNIATNIIFLVAVTLIVTLIIPIVEEIFWRGYAQARFEIIFGSEIALFAQAIAYAGLHLRPIGGFFTVFVYGLIFGFWRQKRKTLLPIIILHFVKNPFHLLVVGTTGLVRLNEDIAKLNEISKSFTYMSFGTNFTLYSFRPNSGNNRTI
jgi:membrane protease YdiL (CAAX protease family)